MIYRVVRDAFKGYEVQFRSWPWPFWRQADQGGRVVGINTFHTLEEAEEFAREHALKMVRRQQSGRVVKLLGPLTPDKEFAPGDPLDESI